jgi:hypothetical protein
VLSEKDLDKHMEIKEDHQIITSKVFLAKLTAERKSASILGV